MPYYFDNSQLNLGILLKKKNIKLTLLVEPQVNFFLE